MKRLLLVISFAAILAALFVPQPLAGQISQVWVEPRVGWLIPTRDLGRTDILGNTGFGVFERVDQSAVLGLGVGVELGAGWAVRASVDRTFAAAVHGEWRCVPFVACPSVLLPLEGELSGWTGAIDALYRLPRVFLLDPIIFAGIGLRRSELDWSQPAADITLPTFSFDETEAVYRLGAGVEYPLGAVTIFGEAEAEAIRFGGGSYESIEGNVDARRKLSLDMGLVGGVRVRLR